MSEAHQIIQGTKIRLRDIQSFYQIRIDLIQDKNKATECNDRQYE